MARPRARLERAERIDAPGRRARRSSAIVAPGDVVNTSRAGARELRSRAPGPSQLSRRTPSANRSRRSLERSASGSGQRRREKHGFVDARRGGRPAQSCRPARPRARPLLLSPPDRPGEDHGIVAEHRTDEHLDRGLRHGSAGGNRSEDERARTRTHGLMHPTPAPRNDNTAAPGLAGAEASAARHRRVRPLLPGEKMSRYRGGAASAASDPPDLAAGERGHEMRIAMVMARLGVGWAPASSPVAPKPLDETAPVASQARVARPRTPGGREAWAAPALPAGRAAAGRRSRRARPAPGARRSGALRSVVAAAAR
jgi:hypothetical protein